MPILVPVRPCGRSPLDGDQLAGARGEFGLTPENPIPTHTVFGSKSYLARLRTRSLEQLSHHRIGSFQSPITDTLVDGYALTARDGARLGTIYISPYCARTSTRAPTGFMLEGVHSAEDGKGRFGENVRTPALNGASSGGSPNENACLPTEGEKEAAQSDRLPLDELKAAAKKGDLHAQSELGQWLLAKPASPYDHQHSEHWLLMAAEDNHPGTQVLLGRLCWEGLLKDYSNRRALYWLDKAMIFGRPSTRGSKIRTFTMASRVAQHGFREAAVGLGQKLDEAEGISEIGPHQSSYSSPETPPNRPTAMTMAEMPIKTQR